MMRRKRTASAGPLLGQAPPPRRQTGQKDLHPSGSTAMQSTSTAQNKWQPRLRLHSSGWRLRSSPAVLPDALALAKRQLRRRGVGWPWHHRRLGIRRQ
mmetsp:Transcript_12589/g.34762  ORF Transcript_12589/g.34762 Transcript_12589/m.34762 type:complete len:98 (-) Transcript_12589:64-357(-)